MMQFHARNRMQICLVQSDKEPVHLAQPRRQGCGSELISEEVSKTASKGPQNGTSSTA